MNNPTTLPATTHEPESAHDGNANRKFGIWLFLSSELLIFCGLIVAFLVVKAQAEKWPKLTEGTPFFLVTLNTFILLASSYTVVKAIQAAQRNNNKRLSLFILISGVLGLMFIAGQAVEYTNLFSEGFGFKEDDPFGTAFFILTGLHGLHVLAGVIWATLVASRARAGAYTAANYTSVEMFGLYWHFVDLVWVLIFTVIYLLG